MYTIQNSIEIAAPLATLHAAVTTLAGLRAWFTDATDVDARGRITFAFTPNGGRRAVTFDVKRTDERGIAMTCVAHEDNAEWLGTELSFTLSPLDAGRTRVDLAHVGYAAKDECYERSVKGWAYFMESLERYATTGVGTPFKTTPAPRADAVAS